ncbi:MAG: hypothetical protein P1P90_00370 [Patescibacteria group bacterium]|nr:hypothetical protein [Patescibacteria group bacterium]
MEAKIIDRGLNPFEQVKLPEILVKEEWGLQLMSVLNRARDKNWGNGSSELSQKVDEYFLEHKLAGEISQKLDELEAMGVYEEYLYNLALAYDDPKRLDDVIALAKKHKPQIIDPRKAQEVFFEMMKEFDEGFSGSEVAREIKKVNLLDIAQREMQMKEVEERIQKLLEFFKPKNPLPQRLVIVPSDPLEKASSGRGFMFGDEWVIKSNIENQENFDHEFLHGIINPIVDKIVAELSDAQKQKISELASSQIKADYGDEVYSILCEEFIRTYVNFYRYSDKPRSLEDFRTIISGMSDEDFARELKKSGSLKEKCLNLGITNREEMLKSASEYYDKFVRNDLRALIYGLYPDYESRQDKSESFEEFILQSLPNKFN